MKKVLTIAGSDSGAGAGIQADLKTFAAFGVYGTSVITAVTAQNTREVSGIVEIPSTFVGLQIDTVMSDIGASVWKTGMLVGSDIIKTVAQKVKRYKIAKLVVDPVMVAKSGDLLLKENAIKTLVKELIPKAFVLTPNCNEAQVLTGIAIKTPADMEEAAKAIYRLGAKNVVLKGGHLDSGTKVIDIWYNGKKVAYFRSPRITTRNAHGTGCTFSASIAAQLALGKDLHNAIRNAKKYVTLALQEGTSYRIGHGSGPLPHPPKPRR